MSSGPHLRRALAAAILALAVTGPTGEAGAQACRDVVSAARAQAAVGRLDAGNGAALAVPATYSQLIYDSIPTVAYNQSGPTTTGQLEDPTGTNPNTLLPTVAGFLPVDPPVPIPDDLFGDDPPYLPAPPIVGRSEAAFPPLQGIPQDSEATAATTRSEAHASPTHSQGRASSIGLGGPDGSIRSGSAFTHASMDCETLTLVVGWEASGVVTAGGTIPSMSQVATLTVSPDGATVEVATNVAQETEEGVPIIEGRPLDAITGPFNEQGTFIDVGEPRVSVEGGRASVSGGGIRYGTADPSRNDTFTFYTLGSLEGVVEHQSVLPPRGAPLLPAAVPPPPASSAAAGAPVRVDGVTTTVITEVAGNPPRPAEAALEFVAAQVQLAGLTDDLTTGSASLWPLMLALLALALIARTAWYAADHGRDRFPTAGFAVDWFRDRGQRFATTYLDW